MKWIEIYLSNYKQFNFTLNEAKKRLSLANWIIAYIAILFI